MKQEIYIRDPQGKPVKATLLRPVQIKKGFSNLGLTLNADGRFAVTELRSGASIGYTHCTQDEALKAARQKIKSQTMQGFKDAVSEVVVRFGELPTLEPTAAVQP